MTSQPYTYADLCREASKFGADRASYVQVMRRGLLYCARIIDTWTTPDGIPLWVVETSHPETTRLTVPYRNARFCARCICAPQTPCAAQTKCGVQGACGASEDLTC